MAKQKEKIILRSYPKAIFLYVLAIVTFIIIPIQAIENNGAFFSNLFSINMSNWLSILWLGALLISFFIISIEVKLSKFCAVLFGIVALGVVLYTVIGGAVVDFIIIGFDLVVALPLFFYISVLGILVFILGAMWVGAHSDYVKVERNEIWCMKGIASKSKERFPTRSIEINIEKPDFIEQILGWGRVTIKIPSLNKYIILDTVFGAKKKVKDIDDLLSSIDVIDVTPINA